MKERNYWMHRITHEREVKEAFLKKESLLFTGWGELSNDAFLESVLYKEKPEYDRIYMEKTGQLPHNRFFLYMFLNEYGKGDFVVVPGNKDFSVYEIISETPFSKEHVKEIANDLVGLNIAEDNGKYYVSDTGEELELGFFWNPSGWVNSTTCFLKPFWSMAAKGMLSPMPPSKSFFPSTFTIWLISGSDADARMASLSCSMR